jgi:hypothetical protein
MLSKGVNVAVWIREDSHEATQVETRAEEVLGGLAGSTGYTLKKEVAPRPLLEATPKGGRHCLT